MTFYHVSKHCAVCLNPLLAPTGFIGFRLLRRTGTLLFGEDRRSSAFGEASRQTAVGFRFLTKLDDEKVEFSQMISCDPANVCNEVSSLHILHDLSR
jgi:hypothetical protein